MEIPVTATPVTQVPQFHIKNDIGFRLFGRCYQPVEYHGYFEYLRQETNDLEFPKATPHDQQVAKLALRTHEDILVIVDVLRRNPTLTREAMREILHPKLPDNQDIACDRKISLNRAIDVSIRRWLLINTREADFRMLGSGGSCISWNDETTLQDFVSGLFPRASWIPTPREGRLSPHFTAAQMVNICGLEIRWTNYLEKHLYLNCKDKILFIFPFKCCLRAFLYSRNGAEPADGMLLPQSLLIETIRSLDLLFPSWDEETRNLLDKEKQDFHNTEPVAEFRQLNLVQYDHWRERLLDLYDEIYLSPPASWRQLWRDRRSPQQFWAFWIALVILVLTMISTTATIAQTWASFQSLR